MFEKSTVRIVVFLFFKLTKREVTYALVISLLKKFVQLFDLINFTMLVTIQ